MATSTSTLAARLFLRADAKLEPAGDGRVLLIEGHMRMGLGPLGPGLQRALAALARSRPTEAELVQIVTEAEDEMVAFRLQMILGRLRDTGWLSGALTDDGGGDGDRPARTLAERRPIGHTPPKLPWRADLTGPLGLSRFAHLRADGGEAIVESPLVAATIVLTDPRLAALLARLATPASPAELAEAMAAIDLGPDAAAPLARWLAEAGVLVNPDREQDGPLALWSFPDLLFHHRSRVGRNLGDYGGSYRFEGRRDPLPALKPVVGETVALPGGDALPGRPLPLVDALEQRRARRDHHPDDPIALAELGELLYRTARARAVFHDGHEELSSRPYPGGGALYELELYPVVHRCAGLDPGMYRYDPGDHRLETVRAPGPETTLLLQYAKHTAVIDDLPQVLLVFAARFGRAMWKYESMAYALVLKDVGVLYGSISLAATAMGLAACPLGGGHADGFCAAAGVDPNEESSVGELILGRPAPER
jgi:SagB-type dehydrogenase family enzyme